MFKRKVLEIILQYFFMYVTQGRFCYIDFGYFSTFFQNYLYNVVLNVTYCVKLIKEAAISSNSYYLRFIF